MEEHDLGRITVEAQKVGLTVSAWVRLQLKKVLTNIRRPTSNIRSACCEKPPVTPTLHPTSMK